jgi:glyceraldehyde-3-phosphate dehydrogenase (NAD(P))
MSVGTRKTRVAVNGYGVIGKRVADAIAAQEDMELAGVADVTADWRMQVAMRKGHRLFAAQEDCAGPTREAGLEVAGALDDLLAEAEVVVDCTPKPLGARNAETYRRCGVKFVLQGGEKHEAAGRSFVAEVNHEETLGRNCTRVVSCNTTSVVRTLGALKRAGLLVRARGTIMRRATDPWESHKGGIMNTLVPEAHIPSHQGPDARSVDPDLDVVTIAVKAPETLAHLHSWSVQLARAASRDEVLEAFRSSSRIALLRVGDGHQALNTIKEMTSDLGRPRGDLYEVALWEDLATVQGDEAFYAYAVDNQAIVIPENIDAIRALVGAERSAQASIERTNAALGIGGRLA